MSGARFVDTNVLLYAISDAADEAEKTKLARALLEGEDLACSVQVLQEFYVQATRPTRRGKLAHEDAVLLIESWLRFPVSAITSELMQAALDTRKRFGLSYWDAAILEAARALGCRTVLSEDLNDGADYAGVRVLNPFRRVK